MYKSLLQISIWNDLKLFRCLLCWAWPPPTHCRRSKACSAYICIYYLCVCLSICLSIYLFACVTSTICPQICKSCSIFCATQGSNIYNNPPYSNIWWHLHFKENCLWSVYSTAQRHEKKITVSQCHRCGDKQRQWLALQWFGSLGCCGEARLNDLHRVVVSYRPALKALAGHAETQAEEMGVESQADTQRGGAAAHVADI